MSLNLQNVRISFLISVRGAFSYGLIDSPLFDHLYIQTFFFFGFLYQVTFGRTYLHHLVDENESFQGQNEDFHELDREILNDSSCCCSFQNPQTNWQNQFDGPAKHRPMGVEIEF